ncbi:TonB-dependent receptor [Sphingomonas koreensis]|nr:TonB-dependent receptor [Sphingomonas koreensis]
MLSGAACAFVSAPATAQQSTAALRGVITDGGQPAGTSVAAVNVDTGFRRVSPITSGAYNFASLPPGRYRLDVTTAGGTRQTDVFSLSVAQNAELSFDLSAGAAAAASGEAPPPNPDAPAETATNDVAGSGGDIIVTGSKIQSLDAGSVGTTIDQHTIESLPQNNRNFLAFADLAPGVQFVTGDNGQTSLRGGAQSSNAVNVFIDGVSQKDDVLKSGITGQDSSQGNPFPQLAIGEYKVISQNYKAEFDQVGSAAITAVTKSGTNSFHGEAFGDFSNQSLRAATPQEKADGNGKIKTQDIQFGAALGGPIIKDVMHFFVTYEGKRQKNPIDIFASTRADEARVPDPYQSSFGAFSQRFHEDLYFGKIDISPTTDDLIEASIKVRREDGLTPGDGQLALSARSDIKNNETRAQLHYQHTGDGWLNDANLSYEKSFFNPTPNDVGQGYQQEFHNAADGNILIYGAGIDYQKKGQKGWTLQDDLTVTSLEHHTIKIGVKGKWVTLNAFQQSPFNPHLFYDAAYSNPLDSDGFNDTLPHRLQFGVPVDGSSGGGVRSHDFQFGVYAQDDWDVSDRLTLNIGARWDLERNSAYLSYVTPPGVVAALNSWANIQATDYRYRDYISNGHNREIDFGEVQPRLGFTYDVSSDGRFQVFGGYGRSYNRDQFDFLALERLQGSYKTVTYNFNTGDTNNANFDCDPTASTTCIIWDPAYLTQAGRDTLATGANDGNREVDLIDNNLKTPYSDQFSLGARGRFGALHAEVGYTHVASRDGFAFFLGNRLPDGSFYKPGTPPANPNDQLPSAGSPFDQPLPGYNNLILGTNGISTNLDSVYLKLDKDYSKSSPWSLDVTYTFSLAEENLNDAGASNADYAFDFPTPQDHPFRRSTGVPKHRLIATGSADLPFGFMLSSKLTLQSPSYIYGTALADVDDPYNYPGIPVVVQGKNKHSFIVGDLWAVRQLDLALTKYIGLGFLHEGTQIRLRADVFNIFNTHNYTSYEGNARGVLGNNINNLPASFGTVNGLSTGGYPPRTFKFTVGMSF